MKIIVEQEVEIVWCTQTRKYYVDKGYKFTNYGDKFQVNMQDIPPNSNQEIKLKCDCCKKDYSTTYRNYYSRINKYSFDFCKECFSEYRRNETRKKYFDKIVKFCDKHEYILLTTQDKIKNLSSKVTYVCPKHGTYTTSVNGILHGGECYKCSREKASLHRSQTTLEERQNNLYNNAVLVCKSKNYKLISKKEDIKHNITYIKYICPIHGEHQMRISNLITGRECPECAVNKCRDFFKLKPDQVEKRIRDCGGILLNKQDYKNRTIRNLKIKCPKCGVPFTTSLVLFTQHGGQVCSKCSNSESLGEIKIRKYLEKNHIPFEREKWFSDCRDSKPLPFDFYLKNCNTIIEFDGRQHFQETDYFSYSYEQTVKHDNIKNNYCKEHNINLIRIPYWDINHIDEILKESISHEDIV